MKCYKNHAGIKVLAVEYTLFGIFKIQSKNELFSTEKEIQEHLSTIAQQPLSGSPECSPKCQYDSNLCSNPQKPGLRNFKKV